MVEPLARDAAIGPDVIAPGRRGARDVFLGHRARDGIVEIVRRRRGARTIGHALLDAIVLAVIDEREAVRAFRHRRRHVERGVGERAPAAGGEIAVGVIGKGRIGDAVIRARHQS